MYAKCTVVCVLARSVCKILWLLCQVGSSHGCWQLIRPGDGWKGGRMGGWVWIALHMSVAQVTNFDNVRWVVCIWRHPPPTHKPHPNTESCQPGDMTWKNSVNHMSCRVLGAPVRRAITWFDDRQPTAGTFRPHKMQFYFFFVQNFVACPHTHTQHQHPHTHTEYAGKVVAFQAN